MYTVCPKCTLTLAVTANDLRAGQGYVRCGRCANVFNALLTLSEDPSDSGTATISAAPSDAAPGGEPDAADGQTAQAHSQALPTHGPETQLRTELSFDGSIENESTRAEGTGSFETILLEGDAITQTEEFVPEESVDSELEALTMRLGVPAHELSAASEFPGAQQEIDEAAAALDAAPVEFAPATASRPPAHRWAWIGGSVLLALLLLAQAMHHWRDSLAQSPLLTPLQEYLVKWNSINQHFLAHPLVPEDGALLPPRQAGLGMDLDPGKIERQADVLG